ncbi:hypothetical protein [Okeania sp. SIO1I7]|uniref:hypothetical protein n=1 Tax=Okeania sp. SIO1I7 TaxID=2607772 RepID=UPI0025D8989D|nr:hypothetical protein [Okeania sp. SIO1I7]
MTCVSNVGTSLIVDGKHPPLSPPGRGTKGVGWYNKQISTLKENQPTGFWSNKLAAITEKRNRQIRFGYK